MICVMFLSNHVIRFQIREDNFLKKKNKMAGLSSNMSVIIININSPNISNEKSNWHSGLK